jgi:hypothetical protein
MRVIGQLRLSFWLCALGAIVLYAFFLALAHISPVRVSEASVVVAALTMMVMVRSMRLGSELADPGGDPRIRRALNRQRERRGF